MAETTVKKILYVNSEMSPYLPDSDQALEGKNLPCSIQELKKEIRVFMPRFGCINERKHQLHEVIRLSGMNIAIGDSDRPLVIKVASLPSAKIMVYFIDNEDYFKRRFTFRAEDGTFFEDNGERAIFYARGVLETAKKLRWAPDVIHCQGWMSQVLPLYLKKIYKEDPIFSTCKLVLTLDESTTEEKFSQNFHKNILFGGITPEDTGLEEGCTGIELAKLAVRYSDGIILHNAKPELVEYCKTSGKKVLEDNTTHGEDGSYIQNYNDFYENL